MGSLNPLIILPGALAERSDKLAEGLASSVLLGAGQFCTKPGLVFLIDAAPSSSSPAPVRAAPRSTSTDDGSPLLRDFIDALSKKVSASAPFTMLNKTLRDAFADRVASWTAVPGVKTLVAGDRKSHASMPAVLFQTTPDVFLRESALHEEIFGPGTLLIRCKSIDEALTCIDKLGGSLTGTLHLSDRDDAKLVRRALRGLESLSGRIIINGYPTGVEVCHAIVHGGPYPATTDPGSTSVGTAALRRFTRMIAFQDTPQILLPPELRDENPLKINRLVNGYRTDRPL
jgi:NADP-dependent aldehyde dehydrogenase